MYVGALGNIPFIVSKPYLRTFRDYGRESGGRWAKHEIVGEKPVLEFLGPDIEKISFKMLFRADQGVTPSAELEKLRKLRDTGKASVLILGWKPVGKHLWVVESLGETVNYWSTFGRILSATVDVTLAEYTERMVV